MSDQNDEQIHIDSGRASGGQKNTGLRYVLAISLLAAIALLSAIWISGALWG